jgi:putative ABC transport system permease protein
MIWNYLVTAMRNFARHKLYSFINIAGLAVGLACAIFIILYLRDELSYDKWIADSQDIYRIESTFALPGADPRFFSVVPFPVPIAMQAQIPSVVAEVHLIPENMTAKIGDQLFAARISVVDPNFLQVIKLPLVKGDPARVLAQPDSVVLSEATAKKFFGDADPIGKTVTVGDTHPLTVTGVLRDLPHNTGLVADLMMPNTSKADTLDQRGKESWLNVEGWGYVKLAANTDPAAVRAKLIAITDKGIDAKKQVNLNIPGSDLLRLHLTRLGDTHLAAFGDTEAGSMTMIYGFGAIAGLILLIACFNFMTLATARAMIRAREVSLRKVMGATRQQLIVQFLGESVMTALIALVLALVLVELLLPAFDSFLTRPIAFNVLGDWPLTIAVVMIAIAAGLFGGIYPALILSGFRPAATLGTSNSGMSGSGLLRTTLVVLQFAISIGLGIATIVVFAQIHYVQQVDIGFDRHNLVVFGGAGPLMTPSLRDSMKQALAADPAIAGVAGSNMTPMDGSILVTQVKLPAGAEQFTLRIVNIDPDFLRVWNMKLLAGRNLSLDRGEDTMPDPDTRTDDSTGNILVTQAAAHQLGFTVQGAVGQSILVGIGAGPGKFLRCTIVGVTGDANFDGIETAMLPIIYFYFPKNEGNLTVRIKPGQLQPALAAIDRVWHRFVPTRTIRRQFQDENFDKLFASTEKEGAIFGMFVGIAIFIACLGLFGLAAFTAERRTREIGIRKVFGARTRDIVRLLLWQFSIPVLVANVIAWPVAWFYLHHWLQTYAYRISLNPLYFLAASVITLAIAWATMIAHAVRVARANPVRALRYE